MGQKRKTESSSLKTAGLRFVSIEATDLLFAAEIRYLNRESKGRVEPANDGAKQVFKPTQDVIQHGSSSIPFHLGALFSLTVLRIPHTIGCVTVFFEKYSQERTTHFIAVVYGERGRPGRAQIHHWTHQGERRPRQETLHLAVRLPLGNAPGPECEVSSRPVRNPDPVRPIRSPTVPRGTS